MSTNRFTRRNCLQAGLFGFGALTLPELLARREASAATISQPAASTARAKSVILIWLRGGPSHIDSWDMKPDQPAEIRGEFVRTQTNVPGVDICDLMPLQATIMDKIAIVRGIKSNDLGDHTPHYILTGSPNRGTRPAFGAVVSKLQPSTISKATHGLPPYVSLMYKPPALYDNEGPVYVGASHRPFVPRADGLANLQPKKELPLARLDERIRLLRSIDSLARDRDAAGSMTAMDSHVARAWEIVSSPKVSAAFDLKQESQATYDRYGKYCEDFLRARRMAEAGVPVITLKVGDWDTHEHNFRDMRDQLPQLDRGFHALVTDLHDRGLQNEVAVVMWGEFGRAPRVSRIAGRDHWPEAGAAVIAGGGFKMGQAIGATDAQGARAKGKPYTPANVLATMYRHLGIDPAQTLPDHNGRPMHLLDERELVTELI